MCLCLSLLMVCVLGGQARVAGERLLGRCCSWRLLQRLLSSWRDCLHSSCSEETSTPTTSTQTRHWCICCLLLSVCCRRYPHDAVHSSSGCSGAARAAEEAHEGGCININQRQMGYNATLLHIIVHLHHTPPQMMSDIMFAMAGMKGGSGSTAAARKRCGVAGGLVCLLHFAEAVAVAPMPCNSSWPRCAVQQ